MLRLLLLFVLAALAAPAQTYDGPRPPKPDLPYLKHANTLVPTEAVVAKEEGKSRNTTFIIDGATSSAVTPLASPIFLLKAEKTITPEDVQRMELYRLDSKGGRRTVVPARTPPIRLEATRLTADQIWRVEVDESLEPGEYSLTIAEDASNRAWCFKVR